MSVSNNPNNLPNVNTQSTWVKGFRPGKSPWKNGVSPSKALQVGSDASHVSTERPIEDQKADELRENTLPKEERPPEDQKKISRGVKLSFNFNFGLSKLSEKVSSFVSKLFQLLMGKPKTEGKVVDQKSAEKAEKAVVKAEAKEAKKSAAKEKAAEKAEDKKAIADQKAAAKEIKEAQKAVSSLIKGSKENLDFGKALEAAKGQTPLFKKTLFNMIKGNATVEKPKKGMRPTTYTKNHLKNDKEVIDFLKLAKEVTDPKEFNEVLLDIQEILWNNTVIDSLLVDDQGALKPEAFSLLNLQLDSEFETSQTKGGSDSLFRANNIASKLLTRYLTIAGQGMMNEILKEVSAESLANVSGKNVLDQFGKLLENNQVPEQILQVLDRLRKLPGEHGFDQEKFKNFEFTTLFLRLINPRIMQEGIAKSFPKLTGEITANLQYAFNFEADIQNSEKLKGQDERKNEILALREKGISIANKLSEKLNKR